MQVVVGISQESATPHPRPGSGTLTAQFPLAPSIPMPTTARLRGAAWHTVSPRACGRAGEKETQVEREALGSHFPEADPDVCGGDALRKRTPGKW